MESAVTRGMGIPLVLMVAVLTLLPVGIARADSEPTAFPDCNPDGTPVVILKEYSQFANAEVTVTATDQAGQQTTYMGNLDAGGNGTIPFGEPGVGYEQVTVAIAGQQGPPLQLGPVTCEAPAEPPASIEVDPSEVRMGVGDSQVFTTTFQDESGNEIPVTGPMWSTSGGGTLGTDCQQGGTTCTYTATYGGDNVIVVGVSGSDVLGVAHIVTNGPAERLTSIEITPQSVNTNVGQPVTFFATARNQGGDAMAFTNPTWTTSGGGTLSGCTGTSCTYTATTAGDFTITVGEGGTTIEGTATIEVMVPPGLTKIDVTPPAVSMTMGQEQVFIPTGLDQSGDPHPLSSPTWSTSGGGTLSGCTGTLCTYTATTPGDYTITVTEGGTTIQATATIEVMVPPGLTEIDVTPPAVSMRVGEEQVLTATGIDQNGDPAPLTNPTWTTSGGGTLSGCTGTSCTYTATAAGDFTITVGEGSVAGITRIQVRPTDTSPVLWVAGGALALVVATGAAFMIWRKPPKATKPR